MKTDTICAFQLEVGDFFTEKGEEFSVKSIDRDDDYMDFTVTETATGDDYPMTFAPFDTVTIITSFLDDDSVDDAFIDVEL